MPGKVNCDLTETSRECKQARANRVCVCEGGGGGEKMERRKKGEKRDEKEGK